MQADLAIPKDRLLPAIPVDITSKSTLEEAFQDASMVVSLVGIMHGSPQDFERIQVKGAENVATVAKNVGAKLVHFSAIGADPSSKIPYYKTKGLAEHSVLNIDPGATIVRPSLVFGPEDDFFNVRIITCLLPDSQRFTSKDFLVLGYPCSVLLNFLGSCPFCLFLEAENRASNLCTSAI